MGVHKVELDCKLYLFLSTFYSPQLQSQVLILIIPKWPVGIFTVRGCLVLITLNIVLI